MTDHVLTYLCQTMAEVESLHLERLRLMRDEGFVVHVCACEDDAMDALAREGFVLRPLPKFLGLEHNLAAWLVCWGHLVENPPTVLHGFGVWSWTAALAGRQLPIQVTCISPNFRTLSFPRWLPSRIVGRLPIGPQDAIAWLGRGVDRCLVDSEAQLADLGAGISPEKLELVVGAPGVQPCESTYSTDAVLTVFANAGFENLRRAVERRVPRLSIRDTTEASLQRDLDGTSLFFDAGGPGSRVRLMQAAARGIPCVTLEGENEDVVVQGRTGLIATDLDDAVVCMLALLENPKLRQEMSVNAHSRAASRFMGAQVDDQIVRIYQRALRTRMGL